MPVDIVSFMNNASNTLVRKAGELDAGSRIVVGGAIRTVVHIHDLYLDAGVYVSMSLDNGCGIIERAKTLYTCLAAE